MVRDRFERIADRLVEQGHGGTQRRPPNVPPEDDDDESGLGLEDADGAIGRLREIQGKISQLADEAIQIVKDTGKRMVHARAEAYWLPHIMGALGGSYGERWLGGSMTSMEDTIKELQEEGGEEEEEEEGE